VFGSTVKKYLDDVFVALLDGNVQWSVEVLGCRVSCCSVVE